MNRLYKGSIVAAIALLFLSVNVFAQNSGVSGTAADSSGALIPGVTITATNNATGIVSTTVTNEAGTYNLLSLQPGNYKISASLPGFSTETYTNYAVSPNQQFRLNFTLKVSSLATSVEVSVDASTLLTMSSSSIGSVLTDQKVRDLPLVGEDVLQLISTMAGVVGENFAG